MKANHTLITKLLKTPLHNNGNTLTILSWVLFQPVIYFSWIYIIINIVIEYLLEFAKHNFIIITFPESLI